MRWHECLDKKKTHIASDYMFIFIHWIVFRGVFFLELLIVVSDKYYNSFFFFLYTFDETTYFR